MNLYNEPIYKSYTRVGNCLNNDLQQVVNQKFVLSKNCDIENVIQI